MEGRKPAGSSSSFTSELSGSKDSSSSSSGIFTAIFSPPFKSPKVLSRESLRSELGKKLSEQPFNYKHRETDENSSKKEGDSQGSAGNKDMSSYYQDQRVQQPCQFSSSIYYGGQDICNYPQDSQYSAYNSVYNKDGSEIDDGTACRGNWWQGSLYY